MTNLRKAMLEGWARILDAKTLEILDQLVPDGAWSDVLPASLARDPEVSAHRTRPERVELYIKLVEVIGADAAEATLAYLPPLSWLQMAQRGLDGPYLGTPA